MYTETPIQGFFGKQWIWILNLGKCQIEEIFYSWSMKVNMKWEKNLKFINIKWDIHYIHYVYVLVRICVCTCKYSLLCDQSRAGSQMTW